jgi:hypothetical protein
MVVCFFFFFLSTRESACLSSFLFVFQFQSLCFLLLIFFLSHFRKVFYIFNLVLKLQFVIFFFSICFLLFWFLIFSLDSFIKILLIFDFILQSKFMLFYFFQYIPHSFDFFFLLLKFFSFQFNPLIYFFIPSNLLFILIFTTFS